MLLLVVVAVAIIITAVAVTGFIWKKRKKRKSFGNSHLEKQNAGHNQHTNPCLDINDLRIDYRNRINFMIFKNVRK